jgi:hypothetical protein
MESAPAPGFIRNPGPPAERNPGPPAVIIRTPECGNSPGSPDIAVRRDVDPIAVGSQFILKIFQFFGEVTLGQVSSDLGIPLSAPSVEAVLSHSHESSRTGSETGVGDLESLFVFDQNRACFSSRFDQPCKNEYLGLAVLSDIDPVESCIQDINGDIGRVDLDIFLFF